MKFVKNRYENTPLVKKALWVISESIDAILIIGWVFVVGMLLLFFNVFRIEVYDFFRGDTERTHVVIDENSWVTKTMAINDTSMTKEINQFLSKNTSITIDSLYAFDLRDYLRTSLTHYNLPMTTLPPGQRIIVDSQNINAPIVTVDYASPEKLEKADFAKELKQWVVKYPGTDLDGKMLVFGHSSVASYQTRDNPYGFVFYKLPKVVEWDTIRLIRDGKVYRYTVTSTVITAPDKVAEYVKQEPNKRGLVLMACYPLLSTAKRILVIADLTVDKSTQYSYLGDRISHKSKPSTYAYK